MIKHKSQAQPRQEIEMKDLRPLQSQGQDLNVSLAETMVRRGENSLDDGAVKEIPMKVLAGDKSESDQESDEGQDDTEQYDLVSKDEVKPDRLYDAIKTIQQIHTWGMENKQGMYFHPNVLLVIAVESMVKELLAGKGLVYYMGKKANEILDEMKVTSRISISENPEGLHFIKENALEILEKQLNAYTLQGDEDPVLAITLAERIAVILRGLYREWMAFINKKVESAPPQPAEPAPVLVESLSPTTQTLFFSSYKENPVKLWRIQYEQLQNEIISLIASKFEGSEVSSPWKRYLQNVESQLFPVFTFPELFRRNWASQAQQQAIDPATHATEVTTESLPVQWISDDQQKEMAAGRYTLNDLVLLVNVLQDYNRHLLKPLADDYRRQIKASQVADGQRWSSANADEDARKARLGMGILI